MKNKRKMTMPCLMFTAATLLSVGAAEPAMTNYWTLDTARGGIMHTGTDGEPVVLNMQGRKVVMQVQSDRTNGFSYTARFFNLLSDVEKKKALFVAGRESSPEVRVNDQPWKSEFPSSVTFDGLLTLTYPAAGGVVVTRTVYPSMTKALVLEEWHVRNTTGKQVAVTVAPARTVKPVGEDIAIVWNCPGVKTAAVKAGGVLSFATCVQARLAAEPDLAVNVAAERSARRALAEAAWSGPGRLETPEPALDAAFALQKLHVLETPIETIKGVITHNGSLTYSPGIWANDPVEYSSPVFPFFGDAELNRASMGMYRIWQDFCLKNGIEPFPGSFEHADLKLVQRERGDDAMVLYGLSKFLLFQGDRAAAEELWPLIEFSAASVLRNTTNGIIASRTDEMEGRYPTGKANLSTSALAYGGYRLAARLAQSLGKPVAAEYDQRAEALRKGIEAYFGAEVEGFKTYRYYDGNTTLRGWILLPLAMGITERQEATVAALTSDKLWPHRQAGADILAESTRPTEWGRETYYALRVLFKAGRTEEGLDLTRRVVQAQIFGSKGPYPDEDAIDMLCPGSLYPRVFTEGMFGIVPTSLDSFECTPWLPKAWPRMALRDLRAFGRAWDLVVERAGDQQKVTVRSGGKTVMSGSGPAGKTYSVAFPDGKGEKPRRTQQSLPIPGEVFEVDGRTAFAILPAAENLHTNRPTPWVWYAPTLSGLPEARERWMFERFLAAGIAVAGVDVGESYGSPQGRAHFTALYQELIGKRGFSRKPILLPRSRGGLMLYNWAAEHPDSVGGIAGIYPVGDLRSWPGLDQACGAYGLTAAQLEEQLKQHNPIDRLAPLAKAGVPIFHIHGNADEVVPLKDNSALLASRYRELGGSMRLRIPPGQGHNVWDGFFQCQELVEFVIAHASPAASREPTVALFRNPPMEARPGAFWDWMNGNVDLDRMTYELEEMKAKGMSGAEIWDIGVIHTHPEEKVPAGPPFLGPESLKAVNHAIEQADRLGLHLGMVASSSWNAGGSWIKPQESMKGIYASGTTVQGPASLSQVLPFPVVTRAAKGEDGLPIYYREIAVLAFPEVKSNTIADISSVINLSSKMDSKGLLTWEVPAGTWVIQRFVNSMTGEKLKVPSPNSNGLLIDHLDANAARSHFQYIIDQILTMRPSLDAMRYMEVDSVEIGRDTSQDWTDTFVEEFRKRRGYDPIPYLPALKGKSFSDALLTSRFRQDYRKTVSDLWIDGHYRASTKFLNSYGMTLVAEGGHGGYPRVEPLKAMGVVDIPRGEFWNGSQFWVVKEAASAAHIYGLQVVDCESFTGWRSWQDGPLEYKRLFDTSLCDGLNRVTFHTFAHTPPSGGVPGNMYHAGEHFNVNATWWHQSGPMLSYFSRCCYLLQQGLPVGDVCFYYGDAAPNLVATRRIGPDSKRLDGAKCAHCGRPNPTPADALGTGYDYDVIDSEVIQDRLQVNDGRLILPHGVSYEALIVPHNEEMPLPVLAKLEKLVLEGATVLGPRPTRTPSLADSSSNDEKVREITGRLWGAVTDAPTQDKVVGKGRIIPDSNRIREVLQKKGFGPDFSYTSSGTPADLDYIHRRTLNSDIYFVSNTQMTDANAECTFRVHGRKPQFWHPDTGEITPCTGYTRVAGGMKLRVHLPPAGSVFVVFSGTVTADLPEPLVKVEGKPLPPHEITGHWEVRFQPNRGAPESCKLDKLVSWTEMSDDGIKYFSGTATYLKKFEVSEAWIKGDLRVELSLGELRNVAEVTVNGKPLGILWKPPYKVDVTGLLKPGENELKIDITNLWANRIAGDGKLPREKRVTRITQKVPVQGPHPSGLFGPVQLLLTQ